MSMDRHRFSKRSRDLIARAQIIDDLSRVPDRMTEKDFRLATDLMRGAASDLDELVKATPTGCICRRIQDNNYDYLDYAEACLHHRQLHTLREKLKADYAKMELTLKDEPRMRVLLAALTGAALRYMGSAGVEHTMNVESYVYNARAIADEVVRRLTETA